MRFDAVLLWDCFGILLPCVIGLVELLVAADTFLEDNRVFEGLA